MRDQESTFAKKRAAEKKRSVARLLKGNNVRRDSALARVIHNDVDSLYRELDANDETRRAIERANNVTRAKCAAACIRQALKVVEVASKSGKNRALTFAFQAAKESWSMAGCYISSSQSTAEVLQLVADEFKGKLRPAAKGDEAIIEAYGKAIGTGKRYQKRTTWFMPFLDEVYDAFDKGPNVPWSRPNKDHLRKRLKILGLPISEDPISQRFKTL
jgi:hypothetical protein